MQCQAVTPRCALRLRVQRGRRRLALSVRDTTIVFSGRLYAQWSMQWSLQLYASSPMRMVHGYTMYELLGSTSPKAVSTSHGAHRNSYRIRKIKPERPECGISLSIARFARVPSVPRRNGTPESHRREWSPVASSVDCLYNSSVEQKISTIVNTRPARCGDP